MSYVAYVAYVAYVSEVAYVVYVIKIRYKEIHLADYQGAAVDCTEALKIDLRDADAFQIRSNPVPRPLGLL